jgi:hypothetical protein
MLVSEFIALPNGNYVHERPLRAFDVKNTFLGSKYSILNNSMTNVQLRQLIQFFLFKI